MVEEQIEKRGIKDPRVLHAMRKVPRHEFVPEDRREYAYEDHPLAIGHDQTISQPYIVAYMTEALQPEARDRVLEIGTGSGYQAAVLAEVVADVYSIEIVEPLAETAKATLERLGYRDIHLKVGDGYQGWPEAAPFDAVIVTCSPEDIPQPLIDQLKDGGRMIIPVGDRYRQSLVLLRKEGGRIQKKSVMEVRFVPMTGEAQE